MEVKTLERKSVTVQDVAREAGVSKATAARVLGNYGTASPSVRDKVRDAARALGYQANELARSMTTGRSGTIGVVVGDIENPYFGRAVRGISDVARAAQFDIILANSGEDVANERAAVRVLLGKQVDGLIVSPASMSEAQHLVAIERSGRPLVLMDRSIPDLNVDTVVADDRVAASAATRLLTEAGHRRIAYVSATDSDDPLYRGPHQISLSTVMDRILGFLDASAQAGIEGSDRYIRLGATRRASSTKIVIDLLCAPDRPTAVLASDSVVALEVFKVIRALGLSIPDDLSLVAFHDADWTSVTSPPITVVSQPVYELGAESARMLLARIEGTANEPARAVLATTLIERRSIGPPPADAIKRSGPRRRRLSAAAVAGAGARRE